MNIRGRAIDPIKLWEAYVEFPTNMDDRGPFLPLVYCPNPAHDNSRSPAFQINVHEPKVHCFSRCGISGSYLHALCVIHGLYDKHKVEEAKSEIERRRRVGAAYREARRTMLRAGAAPRGSGTAPARSRKRKPSGATEPVVELAYSKFIPQSPRDYLIGRGISSESLSQWDIGWDDEEFRIVIPIKDQHGKTRLLCKRAVREKDHPKYLYTEGVDKNSLLFGYGQLDLGMVRSQGIVVVEGAIDTITNHQDGLGNTVGTLGTGISIRQARLIDALRPPTVYLMFDRDPAGIAGIQMAVRRLPKSRLLVCRYPKGKFDPAELSRKEKFRSVERAVPVRTVLPEARRPKGVQVG
jgi:hypothetical protein